MSKRADEKNGTATENVAECDGAMDSSTPQINFIGKIIEDDLASKKHTTIVTRFPPEPNGYLHLGHAKSIFLNFGLAEKYNGRCHLRFDDTNPAKEEQEYIDSITADVRWLGGDWKEHLYHASDYFDQLYQWACQLIEQGDAYVDDDSLDEIRVKRGGKKPGSDEVTPGQESSYRNRSISENLDLFQRMKAGEFPEGSRVLRAKIDMSSGNMNMRDPLMYRILHQPHPRTGAKWCIYPMYDFAHGQSDSIEGITHSICTLEFELHRPLYEWYQEKLDILRTRQIEFARLEMTYTLMSKRRLLTLVEEKYVRGWDDPRMPTLSGCRRRGITPGALRTFCEKIGVAKRGNLINVEVLEECARDDLNENCDRRTAILRPLRVVITNYPEGDTEEVDVPNHPLKPERGSRKVQFSREIYIDADDFRETPPPKFFRLSPGKEVKLRGAYWIRCTRVVKSTDDELEYLEATCDFSTKGGSPPEEPRNVKGVLHWLDKKSAIKAEFRVYDRLFTVPEPSSPPEGTDWRDLINLKSLEVLEGYIEPLAALNCKAGDSYQFERVGYFCCDSDSSTGIGDTGGSGDRGRVVFNKTVGLQDTFAKETAQTEGGPKGGAAEVARLAKAAERKARDEARRLRAEAKAAEKQKAEATPTASTTS